jgi:lysophospholipase L1-like esterase
LTRAPESAVLAASIPPETSMRRALAVALLSATVLSGAALADSLPLLIGGRVVTQVTKDDGFHLFTSPEDKATYTYQWPGVYFEAAFQGDSVDVKVDDSENNLYLFVDGAHKLTLTKPGKATVALKDLGPGKHIVRLEKASETQSSVGRFEGFFVPSRDDVLPAPVYTRRIEFIGDSYTVGYGNQSRGQTCTVADVAATTDTAAAWGPAVAKHFDAEYRMMAFSGRGIVRNYNGLAPGDTLPVLYNYTLFDHSVPAPADGWTPDAIIVGLGTNDFSTALNANEKWKTRDELHADYIRTYADFIKTLRTKAPNAHIILMASDQAGGEIADNMKAAAALAQSEGVGDLETIVFTGLDWQACHAHPSLKDEVLLANLVEEHLAVLPKFAPPPVAANQSGALSR